MIADIIICVIIFTAMIFAVKSVLRKKGCCCDSAGCNGCRHCQSKKNLSK